MGRKDTEDPAPGPAPTPQWDNAGLRARLAEEEQRHRSVVEELHALMAEREGSEIVIDIRDGKRPRRFRRRSS